MANEALRPLDKAVEAMFAGTGRESIPPEWLLRAPLLQVLHSIRIERQSAAAINTNEYFVYY